jgi:hypothetical protein
MAGITISETCDIFCEITSKKYKYYHKPEYTTCNWCGNGCECIEPILIKHPLSDILPSHTNYYLIVLASVKYNGNSLEYAIKELKDDEIIVKAAVQQAGGALQYASIRLQNSKEIVSIAVAQWSKAKKYASKKLQNDSDIKNLIVFKKNGGLRYETSKLKTDENIINAMLDTNGYAYYQIHPNINFYTITEFIQIQIDRYIKINIVLSKKINKDIINIVFNFLGFKDNELMRQLMRIKSIHK